MIIEYGDIDCPFCTQFHPTLHKIVDKYGEYGDVAWVYRHFPLTQLHPDAQIKAEAAECVGFLGGDAYFWQYLDLLYERIESTDEMDEFAAELGVNRETFKRCLDEGWFEERVKNDYQDARNVGAAGTPHSVVVVDGKKETDIPGAHPYNSVESIIEAILDGLSADKG
jgi:protein-disulfide isomerase